MSTVKLDARDIEAARFGASADLDSDVERLVRPMVESGQTPGVVAGLLLPDGSTRYYAYGLTDQANGNKLDASTQFAVGSLSKGFLAALIELHVDKGDLSWDDTLEALLPPGTPLSADARKITLRQLATHTSGLPRQPINLQTLGYFLEYLFDGENFYRHFDTPYTLDYLSGFRNHRHGERSYSNIGYGLLGYILEHKTGVSLDALLRDEITAPLGMSCTGYDPAALPCYARRAHPHAGDQPMFMFRGAKVPDWEFTELMRGSAAISSNAVDLLKFAAAHLPPSDSHLKAILAGGLPTHPSRSKDAPAIAWLVDDVYGEPITYEVGFVGGYTAYLGIDVEHRSAAVVLQNSFNWDVTVGHRLLVRLRKYDNNPARSTAHE